MIPNLFFIHIPKTAGTSLRMVLWNNYSSQHIFPNKADLSKNEGKYPNIEKLLKQERGSFKNKSLIAGHYGYHFYHQYFRHYEAITFLRNPIERTISNLIHLKVNDSRCSHMSLDEIWANETFMKGQFQNIQTKYLLSKRRYLLSDLTYNNLLKAKSNLASLSFVGILENYELSLKLLESQFNLTINSVSRLNKGETNKYLDKLNSTFIRKIVRANEYDMELYNYGKHIFTKQLKNCKINIDE